MNSNTGEHIEEPKYVAGMSEEELREKYHIDEIVKLGSNENSFGPSPKAIVAMQRAIARMHRYPPMTDESLRAALSASIGRGVTPDHVVTGNGACDVLSMIAHAFLDAASSCVICPPTFPVYEFTAKRHRAEVIYANLSEPGFTFLPDVILNSISSSTHLVYLCSPNNPTGSYLTGTQMSAIVDNLPPDVLVVFDEVYHHFVSEKDRPDAVAEIIAGKPVIAVHSFSKAYGLAGCRLGYAIATPEVVREVSRFRLPFHLNNMTLDAGLAAIDDSEHLARTISTVFSGRSWMIERLNELDIESWPSEGNFVLFRPKHPAEEVSDRLLRQGVIVRPMDNFYLPGYLRVTIGRREDNERFIESLKRKG